MPAAAAAIVASVPASASAAAEAPAATGLTFDATIGQAEFLGEFVRYELAVGTLRVVADLPHERFSEPLAPGTHARFAVAAQEILVLPAA
jgi:hypothetical protein